MKTQTIQQIQDHGFRVYMRKPSDTWCIYTDGKNVAYFEETNRGFGVSTCHRPNRTTGTGYGILRESHRFTLNDLRDGFCFAPVWSSRTDHASIVKYNGIEDFRKESDWNAEYKEVESATVNA